MATLETTADDLINLVGSIFFLIVALLFLYQTRRKNRNTPTLTYGFFIAFFGQLFNTITKILFNDGIIEVIPAIILQFTFITALNLILVFLWIFMEQTNSTSLNRNFVVLVSVTGTAYVVTFILGFLLENIEESLEIASLMFTILLTIVSLRSFYIQYRVYVATGKERTAFLQLIALFLIWVWSFLALIDNTVSLYKFYAQLEFSTPVKDSLLLFGLIIDIIYYTGLAIFILTILINPDYIYRLPLNIQDLVVFSSYGFAVYGIGKNAESKSLDEQLLAGFIVASNSFVGEMKPKYPDEGLRLVRSTNRIIRLEFGDMIGICIVSKSENWYLLKSLKRLVQYIEDQDPQELLDIGTFFEDADMRKWLKMFFPYLEIDSMQTY